MFWTLLLISPFIGSFFGVLVRRLPESKPVSGGRSACDSCHATLTPLDLIPIVSWTFLRGRCRHCDGKISFFYPAIECAAVLIVLWVHLQTTGAVFLASALLGWTLLTLALTDWEFLKLPDPLTLALFAIGAGAAFLLDRQRLPEHVIGAVAGFAVFAGIAALYRVLRKRDGLGLGDAKLMAGIGMWLGWQGLPTVVFLAAASGLLFVLAKSLSASRLSLSEKLPLGTFLAAAAWIVWLYGPLV